MGHNIFGRFARKQNGEFLPAHPISASAPGYASEFARHQTQNLVAEARRKLESKNCDMVVANLVGGENAGFEVDQNEVTIVTRTGAPVALPRASKRMIADQILDHALKLRLTLHASAS